MARAKTQIQILDANLNLLVWIQTPYPLDSAGSILQYSKELSDFGTCKFRISSYDPQFQTRGDILQPHVNHIRIVRGNTIVWSGAIIENSKRTKDYMEIVAAEYSWYLNKILVNRTSLNPATNVADNIYRTFNSGTMAAAVTAIMNETITNYKGVSGVHPLANMTLGQIDNPNYPANMTDGNNPPNPLAGAWNFGNGITAPMLTFDFHSIMYILKSFGVYSNADFVIDENLVFSFQSFLGQNRQNSVSFVWGLHGNSYDFNAPRLGQQMVNDLLGIATDPNGVILHSEQMDSTSITDSGIIQQVAAYADVKDQATLNARIIAELPLISKPSSSPMSFTLTDVAYPLGIYDVGDIVHCAINHVAFSFDGVKRIVGISVNVHNTGRELTTVQLNKPLATQLAGEVQAN